MQIGNFYLILYTFTLIVDFNNPEKYGFKRLFCEIILEEKKRKKLEKIGSTFATILTTLSMYSFHECKRNFTMCRSAGS